MPAGPSETRHVCTAIERPTHRTAAVVAGTASSVRPVTAVAGPVLVSGEQRVKDDPTLHVSKDMVRTWAEASKVCVRPLVREVTAANPAGTVELQPAQGLRADVQRRLAAFYRLAAYSGAGRGELLNLGWADLDLEAQASSTVSGSRGRRRAGGNVG